MRLARSSPGAELTLIALSWLAGCGEDPASFGGTAHGPSSDGGAPDAHAPDVSPPSPGRADPLDAGATPPPDAEPPPPSGITAEELMTGSWAEVEVPGPLPTPRHECGFVELGGKLYLLGGRGSKKTGIFDPVAGTWSEGAAPPLQLHHFQPVAFNEQIYVVAALTGGFPMEPPAVATHVYDPAANTWSTAHPLPPGRHRGSAGVAVRGGKIYVVSGIQNGHWDGWVPWFDAYDPVTGAWEKLPDAPRSRDHVAVAVVGDRLYVAGGRRSSWSDGQNFNLTEPAVDVFDFDAGSWSTLEASLPTPRAAPSVVAVDGFLLVIGGEAGNGSGGAMAFDTVEALDLSAEQWLTLNPLTRPRHATGAVLWAGRIYTAAGSGGGGGSPELDSLEIWSLPRRN